MPIDSVRIVATVTGQPGKAAELKAMLLDLIAPTRAEAGCVSYQLLQNNSDPSDFVFVEEWTSDAAIDEHMASAHLRDVVTRAQSLLAKAPDIRRYSLVA